MKKKVSKKPYMPRVVVQMNTGTRTIKTRKDKANTRQALNLRARRQVTDENDG